MPGPGQGKRSQKKKWRDNALSLNENKTAVNAVTTAPSTSAPIATTVTATVPSPNDETAISPPANETAPNKAPYLDQLSTTSVVTTTTAKMATYKETDNASDATHIDKPTAAPGTVDINPERYPFSYNEVQELLDEARLEGWREGMDEGYKMGKNKGVEDGRKEYEKGLQEGYELGTKNGKEEEQRKWLTEGHGAGLCLSMAAHARELLCGAVLPDEAETQTDDVTTTSVDTQTTPTAAPVDFGTQSDRKSVV